MTLFVVKNLFFQKYTGTYDPSWDSNTHLAIVEAHAPELHDDPERCEHQGDDRGE